MEQINFYTNGSPKQYKAISRWLFMSSVFFIAMAISLASLQLQQWYYHSCLETEKNLMNSELRKLDHIAQYHQNQKALKLKLEKKANFMQQHNKNQKNLLELLKNIKAALKNDATLEAASFSEKNIELKIAGKKLKLYYTVPRFLNKNPHMPTCALRGLNARKKIASLLL